MLIEWGGAGARVVGAYVWDGRGPCDVQDPDLVANLLTQPGESFAVSDEDELAMLPDVGPERAALLALAGVCSLERLADLGPDEVHRVAEQVHGDAEQESTGIVRRWVEEARRARKE